MPLVPMSQILEKAARGAYAVGAFNIINLTFLEAILEAAIQKRSPVILNIAEVHFPFVTLEHITPVVKEMSRNADIEIALNLDHGLSRQAIECAIHNGFTSVMFDGSQLELEENIRQTRQVVDLCHARGISVEAELGAVGGAEGGGLVGEADPAKFTDVAQAARFVRETGVDALAVAIGNSHGRYKGPPQLDFERLRALRAAAGIPLVLHGGSGISTEDFRQAISLGIAKINFFTGMSDAALQATRAYLDRPGGKYNDYPMMINEVKAAVRAVVAEQMKIFGSYSKAF